MPPPGDTVTFTYSYDDAGNILTANGHTYTYGNADWGDLLTAYNGKAIEYDGTGNPISYDGWTYTWEHGRELASMKKGATTWTYTYDANGMRTSRSNGTTTYTYVYNGNQLVQMSDGTNTLYFTYTANGHPLTVTMNGTLYYYITNMQDDVVAIWTPAQTFVCEYIYDAWGKLQRTITYNDDPIINLNPLLYRGYVYDRETSLYYLQSRYYNPEWGRFINGDGFTTTGQGLLGSNMFAYCGNNPVSRADSVGFFWDIIVDIFSLGASLIDAFENPDDPIAWLSVAADVASLVVPCVSGGGAAVKAATKADDVVDTFRAIDSVDDVTDIAKIATTGSPNTIGKIGEQLAGIDPKAKVSININGHTRIPDALTDTTLIEVKNVKYISNTSQLRDFATFANSTGRSLVLRVRPTTKVAQTVIDAGWKIEKLW